MNLYAKSEMLYQTGLQHYLSTQLITFYAVHNAKYLSISLSVCLLQCFC